MFLFLPQIYKEKVKKEYRLRLWASVCIMLGCVFLISAALVFPAYLSAKNAELIAAADYATAAKAEASLGDQTADTELSKANIYMKALKTLVPLDPDTLALQIISAKPNGVSVTSISIGNVGNGVDISVGGVAGTRSELTSFSSALQNVANFSAVTLPVDDLAQDTNIDYTISLSINSSPQ